MTEEQRARADGDDVVVEDAGIDRVGRLLREHRARGGESMPARDRLATLRASGAPGTGVGACAAVSNPARP